MGDFAEMKNNNKATARRHEAEVDRLSKLPDHIILNILERVGTLDALRTCFLSKRMLKLPPMLSLLDIDIGSLARYIKPNVDTIDRIFQYNIAMAAITEKVLSARNPEIPIRKLRVRFCLRPDECLSISKAVAHAMATHKLDVVEFVVLTETICLKCTEDHLLCYAKRFNSWFDDCPTVFAGLTHLWLRNIRFGELDIPNILSACKRLESLRLSYCDAGVYSVIQLEHAQLVELHIDYGEFEVVQLNYLPKLQRVKYVCWSYQEDPLSFGSVPQLSKLTLENDGVSSTSNLQLSQLLADVPWISDLCLDFKSEKIWVLPECPKLLAPVIGKLQIVNLDNLPQGCDIAWTMFILEAASSLKELCIMVWDHWCKMETNKDIWVLPECPKLLAPVIGKLQIVNLDNLPQGCDIAWTMFILEAASSLKELCIMVWDHWCKMETNKDVRKELGYCEKANVEWQPSAVHFKHKNLVKLAIYGFQPEDNFVRYVRRIMEIAVNMKEISLHDWGVCKLCRDLDPSIKICPSRYPRTSEEKDMLRGEITKELPIASPAVIHFRS